MQIQQGEDERGGKEDENEVSPSHQDDQTCLASSTAESYTADIV
jgi:hypothetical protein